MKKLTVLILSVIFLFFAACDTNNSTDPGEDETSGPRGIFTITDSAVDKLSVLEVELTELKIVDLDNNETVVFSQQEGDETFVVNLLALEDVTNLLGSIPLDPGTYKEVVLSFKNATALDQAGNVLTVIPKKDDTVTVKLNPQVTVDEDNVFFEIDFDVKNSVYSVVTGRNGRVELHPNLIVMVDRPPSGSEEDDEITDLKGVIESIQPMSLVVSLNDSNVNVEVTDETIIEIDEFITTPPEINNDLTTVLEVGQEVEIDGPLDAGTNTVTATKIERKWGSPKGNEFQGIVVGNIGSSSFDVFVMESSDSGFSPGATQTVAYDSNTLFLYSDPSEVTSADYLAPGQDVRVTGELNGQFLATRVKLRETKIVGTVAGLGAVPNQISVNAQKVERLSASGIAGFVNPMLVEIQDSSSIQVGLDAKIEVEGHFNRAALGVFLVSEWEAEEEEEEEVEVASKEFSIASDSPLTIDVTGKFEKLGFQETTTIQVVVTGDTSIIEKDKENQTTISQQALIDGINNNRYESLEAEGIFDKESNTLTAKKIKVEIAEEEDD